jgi:acyl dehydratase
MGDNGSLIPPETRALVGSLSAAPVTAEITAKESQRYAQAVGDLNPLYFDLEAAKAAGHTALLAPPTFVAHAVVQGRSLAETRTDGLWRTGERLQLAVQRTMFGGEEWDFLEPVHVGDVITAETRLADLDEKQGSKGPFVRITRETTYTNGEGRVVARSRQIGIAR